MGWIKDRIDAEYRKHKTLDWSAIAEKKIQAEFDRRNTENET